MATIVVAHGAWSSGWAWKKMRPLLRAAGHDIFTPSYTGLGERAHLSSPDIGLDTHIADILAVFDYEDLRDVMLIGHSYGGMVATGVADRAQGRVAQLIYLDAFAPRDGQSLFDLVGPEAEAKMRKGADGERRGLEGAGQSDAAGYRAGGCRLGRRRSGGRSRSRPSRPMIRLSSRPMPQRSYIYCTRIGPAGFLRTIRRAGEVRRLGICRDGRQP